MAGLLPFLDKEPNPEALISPAMAQFHLWLAQIQRDHGNLSDREMARFELKAAPQARRAKTLMNPFTGEIRRIDADGNLLTR